MPIRIYEIARECGVTSQVILAYLNESGHFVKSASSTLTPEAVEEARAHFSSGRAEDGHPDSRRGAGVAPKSQLVRDAEALLGPEAARQIERAGGGTQARGPRTQPRVSRRQWLDREWASRMFTADERTAWKMDGLGDDDFDLAEAYRANGLRPGDLSAEFDGVPVRSWLTRGLGTVPEWAARLHPDDPVS